jgi:ketosteroid isomerase-like protein
MMSKRASLLVGAAAALGLRALLAKLILLRLRRDLARLNDGDYSGFLSAFADDAVLRFNEGPHRWSGDHRGKAAIERFLKDFTSAGLRGEIRGLWISGPPWALTLLVRFDDEARAPDGELIYANEVAIVARTRWGRIVEQEDFYRDTARIEVLERRLQELGVPAAATV